jgi:PhnB protein
VPLQLVLGRTDTVAVALTAVTAFSTGVLLSLAVRWRGEDVDAFEDPLALYGLRGRSRDAAEILRFGVQFSDGRKATTLGHPSAWAAPGEEPAGPLFMPRGASGGEGKRDTELWLWPLPPPGPMTAAVEWPAQGLELTTHEVDAAPIAEAARSSVQFWPETGSPGGSVSQSVRQLVPFAKDQPEASIAPELAVRGGREAVAFYERAFGAVEVYRVGGTEESPDVVSQLSIGGGSFWVSDEAQDSGNFSPEALGGSTARTLLVVDDPNAAVKRATAAGAKEVYPVAEQHGWLLGRVEDPFGHHWEIGKPLVPWPPPGGRPHGR